MRYARRCHPGDLWTSYFTSSDVVKHYRKKYGEPDTIQARKTFSNTIQARNWESKVLRRVGVSTSERWLNLAGGYGEPARKCFEFERRQQRIKERIITAGIEWSELYEQVMGKEYNPFEKNSEE